MNRTITNLAVDPIGQPLTRRTLDFLQDASKEMITGFVAGLVGFTFNGTGPYAVHGAYRNNVITATVGAGYIFYGGELFYFPGIANYNVGPWSNVGVFVVVVTNDATSNPVVFTDNIAYNPNTVRRLTLIDAANGSGLFNFSDLLYVNNSRKSVFSPGSYTTTTSAAEQVGAQLTTLGSGTRKYLATFTADVFFVTAGGGNEGAQITIEVVGTGTVATQRVATTTSIGTLTIPVSIRAAITGVALNSVIRVNIQRLGSNNPTIENMTFILEEYL